MITLNQVQLLQKKVEDAVDTIMALRKENAALKERCRAYENNNADLSRRVTSYEEEQNMIEQGIMSVLTRLNTVEDSIRTSVQESVPAAEKAVEQPVPVAETAPVTETVTFPEPETTVPEAVPAEKANLFGDMAEDNLTNDAPAAPQFDIF